MNRNMLNGILVLILSLVLLMGAFYYFFGGHGKERVIAEVTSRAKGAAGGGEGEQQAKAEDESPLQAELNRTSAQIVADIRTEHRLNLNMLGQLQAYNQMLAQLDSIVKGVDKNMGIIDEITKDEFQENVALQASLFSGKKSDLVAKHLEEFPASRVGAILSKMKDREASAVMDIWAKQKEPRVSNFYREVMSAYLNNKRYEQHPDLFPKKEAAANP